mmetsp:Transcript_512/g.576  ORF Transcript_512/g.576 Transcript_512/m.576 type:complete len:428 (+) Transcript_512:145-1428(+)|eukprot:CAMPEP_0197864140 /NCGR_PEP_ID=MMETSP1438-20131217/42147_1 /TAXON_ID=1461541 /ORGANISM="Pterosperma sp., Strain CCMP1384" /LENGTH=427 /DNA_ID=CAMNT_0043482279 /DNA_START=144 /DNA_END=1427 /DNA_ORIENTATION=+
MEVDPPESSSSLTNFDLESYIGNYSGHGKLIRLQFIADRVGSALELEALRMAATTIKQSFGKGVNIDLWKEVLQRIGDRLGDEYRLDEEQIERLQREAVKKQEKLESVLNTAKTQLIKESIRMANNDLGDFFYERGNLQVAFKCYVRTRDFCTTSRHISDMCLNVIRVSIELGNFVHVANYVQKGEQAPDKDDPISLAKLKCAAGLAALENKKYKVAARSFVEVHSDLGSAYNDVISPQDVAIYGGLCALASFDRAEIKQKVIDNTSFRNFLELVPEVRELIQDFYSSRYASCLSCLDGLQSMLSLDIHLHDHIDGPSGLYAQIRQKALIQYTTPYTSVNLHTLAAAFNTEIAAIEKELAALIMDNQIQARIDSHNKVLYARHADQRSSTFQKTLSTGQQYMQDTKAFLLRASLLQHDMVQRSHGKK